MTGRRDARKPPQARHIATTVEPGPAGATSAGTLHPKSLLEGQENPCVRTIFNRTGPGYALRAEPDDFDTSGVEWLAAEEGAHRCARNQLSSIRAAWSADKVSAVRPRPSWKYASIEPKRERISAIAVSR